MTAPSALLASGGGTVAFLLRYVRRHLRLSLAVVGAVAVGALCAVAAQYGLKLLVDAMTVAPVSAARRGETGVSLRLGLFLALLAAESACLRLGGWLGSRAIIRLGEDIRLDLFESVAARPWAFFNGQASGALAGRITAAATAAATVLRTVAWNLVPPVTDLTGSVVVLATIDWRIAAGLVAVAGAATWGLHRLGRRGFPLHHAYYRESAEVSGSLADVLANIGLVRAYGALARERERLRRLMEAEGRAHARSWMFLEELRCGHDGAFWLAIAAVLSVSVWEWSRGAITTGGVVVASTLTLRVLAGSRELALSLLGVSQQLGAVSEAVEVLQAPLAERKAAPPGSPPPRARAGAIELRSVCYAPEGCGRPLFRDLDLRVPAGQRVGIVGPSGAGKSTLLRLVQGLVEPQAGEVLLDGQGLAGAAPADLAAAFSVVTQEVPLLHRSVAENLRYGRPDATWDDVLAASRAAGCDGFIRGLPQGYDTVVGERGIRLSGGQRQRLAIARALLRQAPVLLLDEATSALDSHAELEVQRALLALAGRRTVLAVAHRLSTVMDFDRVIVLQDGRVVEDGPPYELRRGTGHFAATWRLQQRTFSAEAVT
ncbi:MAG: ABC transporter ATP-binding protein [Acetobacteraceae bacterium]|nr:ABC transporter ATP-binding protein [Acetobacteraceae bacterium]